MARPVWDDSGEAELGRQVRHVGVPAPGGIHEVAALAGELFSFPLSRSGPLWEIWVMEGLEDGRVALLLKVHHALMDGIRGAKLLEVLFDLEPGRAGGAPRCRTGPGRPRPVAAPDALGRRPVPRPNPDPAMRLGAELARRDRQARRRLASQDGHAAALPFRAPRTSLNRPLTRAGRSRSLRSPRKTCRP